VAYRCRVHESGVAADDAALLQLADAVGSGRSGEAEELAQLGPRGATVAHQKFKSLHIQGLY